MRCSTVLVLLLASMGPAYAFAQHSGEERPIGVEAADWITVTETLGFVIVKTEEPMVRTIPGANPRVLLNEVVPAPAAAGYFMVKTDRGWRRLIVMTPEDIAAAAKG